MILLFAPGAFAGAPRLFPIAEGWAENSINAVIFRRGSVTSDGMVQVVAYYDAAGNVMLARRQLGSAKWEIQKTQFRGNPTDAHNSISIMFDGDGFLHLAWDHHGSGLHYARSVAPNSLQMSGMMAMTGQREGMVTYPEFYQLPDGDLIFACRDGSSGRGDLVLKRYAVESKTWTQLQDNFISGEGCRSPYWQMAVDDLGNVHVSWVWRDSPDVASNHDLCYAKSTDGGKTWRRSNGTVYKLPITAATAEYAQRIPQSSDLMNSTSMCADAQGNPFIATYWRPKGTQVPQYMVVYHDGKNWQVTQASQRTRSFNLRGGGTKRVPMSRPQIVAQTENGHTRCYIIFRDEERGNRVSVAACSDLRRNGWEVRDLTNISVGMWEPSFDAEQWTQSKVLHIFVQKVGQGDGEGREPISPQQISILEWSPTALLETSESMGSDIWAQAR
jgi:BNR repeat-containing family member